MVNMSLITGFLLGIPFGALLLSIAAIYKTDVAIMALSTWSTLCAMKIDRLKKDKEESKEVENERP